MGTIKIKTAPLYQAQTTDIFLLDFKKYLFNSVINYQWLSHITWVKVDDS